MGNWCHCDVEVSHDDPAMIDRAFAAASPDWRYLLREFLLTDTGQEPGVLPHLNTRVERLSPTSMSLSLSSKYAPPLELFDRMVELGYRVRGVFDDECMMYRVEYDCGVTRETCPIDELNAEPAE
jgi:hypothetical protein